MPELETATTFNPDQQVSTLLFGLGGQRATSYAVVTGGTVTATARASALATEQQFLDIISALEAWIVFVESHISIVTTPPKPGRGRKDRSGKDVVLLQKTVNATATGGYVMVAVAPDAPVTHTWDMAARTVLSGSRPVLEFSWAEFKLWAGVFREFITDVMRVGRYYRAMQPDDFPQPPPASAGSGFDAQNIPSLLLKLLTASATVETLGKLRTFRSDVGVVRKHLADAAVEVGALDAPAANGAGIVTLLGAIIDHWKDLAAKRLE